MNTQKDVRSQRTIRMGALILLGTLLFAPTAQASCAGPQIIQLQGTARGPDAESSAVLIEPGGVLELAGEWYSIGCDDVAETRLGCNARQQETPEPMTGVKITLSQAGGATWDLATVDATGDRFDVSWSGTVPAEIALGPATLSVGPTSIQIEIVG